MSFGDAVRSGFDNYAQFDGRASRAAFWWWFLFTVLVGIAANIVGFAIGTWYVVQRDRQRSPCCFPTSRWGCAGSMTPTEPDGGC